jgi:hypothetical protein
VERQGGEEARRVNGDPRPPQDISSNAVGAMECGQVTATDSVTDSVTVTAHAQRRPDTGRTPSGISRATSRRFVVRRSRILRPVAG